ncbi:MAG: hypothetical protein CMO80_13885 [Verrucomicrobiales bacterium]|nr:hypothetical protein [Verrucomicrobiales bacterium]|tara:strand:+ start:1082 stop:2524 length:1443 start_codon:yes stop_codon:yes gene_type:complete
MDRTALIRGELVRMVKGSQGLAVERDGLGMPESSGMLAQMMERDIHSAWHSVSRREALRVGGLTALGLSLPDILRAKAAANPKREVNCILLWMLGGPSHIDMYDLKPDAPSEIRGIFSPISTNVRGTQIGELMPNMAKCADKFSIIRSMHSYTATHGKGDFHLMSGNPYSRTLVPPGFGAMISRQQEQAPRSTPPFVQVGSLNSPEYGEPGRAGYLGRVFDPFVVEPNPNAASFKVNAFMPNVGAGRMGQRKGLLDALEAFQSTTERQQEQLRSYDGFQERAFSMITSPTAKNAFDIKQEPEKVRDRYGRNRVGQGMLLARRLVEAGVRFVTVKGYIRYGWDHHPEVFPRLKTEVPVYDQAYAALLNDLHERGMTDNTLVITAGEFGRTPRLNNDPRAPGRDHWSRAFSLTLGGGGINTGAVIGATDRIGGEVTDRPVSVPDFARTVYHALGLDPMAKLYTRDGRPMYALPEGKVIEELV